MAVKGMGFYQEVPASQAVARSAARLAAKGGARLPADPHAPVSLHDQLRCVDRELVMRRTVYPRLVREGKKDQADADREIKVMAAVYETLEELVECRAAFAGAPAAAVGEGGKG